MNEDVKNASIDYIISQGLVKPQTARERIAQMLRTIGFRFIFWDTGYSLFFVAVTLAGALVLLCLTPESYHCSAAVAVAPLLFLLVTLFAEMSERVCGLYEIKQTCRYTIRQITALRVVCYSVVGTVFTAVIAAISADSGYDFLSLFPLCLSALFICAVLGLSAIRILHGKWVTALYSAAWVFVNIALPFWLGERWEEILRKTPIAISVTLAVIAAAILLHQISKILSEVKKYAVA